MSDLRTDPTTRFIEYMREQDRRDRQRKDASPLLIVAVSSIVSICLTLNILLMTGVI